MPPQFTLGEVNIICTDLERSLVFYRDVLGFKLIEQEGNAYHMGCSNARFLLLGMAGAEAERHPYCQQAEISFDLITPDLAATVRHLNKHQVEYAAEPDVKAGYVFIRDPDGLVIEVIQGR